MENIEDIEDNELYGRCESCKFYGKCMICSDCIEGSEYECDPELLEE